MTEANNVWSQCLGFLKENVPNQTYETWFQPIKVLSLDDSEIFLQVPNQFFYDWIESHYREILNRAIKNVTGDDLKINYTVNVSKPAKEQLSSKKENKNVIGEMAPDMESKTQSKTKKRKRSRIIEKGTKINKNYTFDRFVEGRSNQFAKASAIAVAKSPGKTSFNPLVIYGDTGLGKTHLIQAIGNQVLEEETVEKIVYVTSDTFTLDFINAVQKNKSVNFSNYYRDVDMLLLDDIQFFEGKESTQEQFFHIFNSLYQHGNQVVLTTDKHPMELKGMQKRMLSRFQSGLAVDVQPPDLETRIAILKEKAEDENLAIPFDVITYIAKNIKSNVRELEGALIRLMAQSSLLKVDVNLDLARQMLSDITAGKSEKVAPTSVSIDNIQEILGQKYDISLDTLVSKSRKKEVAEARMVAMYFARKLTDLSLKKIGLYFGGRDHSTVVHACKKVGEQIRGNDDFRTKIENIEAEIKGSI